MIVLELAGGLGNQMFQYAAARSLQQKTGEKIACNLYQFQFDQQREYSLLHFALHDNLVFWKPGKQNLYGKQKELWIRILHKIGATRGKRSFETLARHGFAMSFDIYAFYPMPLRKNMYLKSNFQSWKYFAEIRELLLNDFAFREEPDKKNTDMLQRIQQTEAVCVHIRRGDYVTNPKDAKFLNICGKDYYEKAIESMKKQLQHPVFYIFSNTKQDLDWIKQHYAMPEKSIYVDLNNQDYQELRLMKECKHFIISNSTFSWWAQYLCTNTEKIVMAPSRWNNEESQDASDIYMKNWQLIEV